MDGFGSQEVGFAFQETDGEAGLEFEVALHNEGNGFGLTLICPDQVTVTESCYISAVKPGTPAANSDQLTPGLKLLQVNGGSTVGMSQADVYNQLRLSPNLSLVLIEDSAGFQRDMSKCAAAAVPPPTARVSRRSAVLPSPMVTTTTLPSPPRRVVGAVSEPRTIAIPEATSGGSIGITFVGPGSASKMGDGVYVQDVDPKGLAFAHQHQLLTGSKLLAIDGNSVEDSSLLAVETELQSSTWKGGLTVRVDLPGYSKYDGGETLRIIRMHQFYDPDAAIDAGDTISAFYRGSVVVEEVTLRMIESACNKCSKQTGKSSRQGRSKASKRGKEVFLQLSSLVFVPVPKKLPHNAQVEAIQAAHAEAFAGSNRPHVLYDIRMVDVSGTSLGFIDAKPDGDGTKFTCHVYECDADVTKLLEFRRKMMHMIDDGMKRVSERIKLEHKVAAFASDGRPDSARVKQLVASLNSSDVGTRDGSMVELAELLSTSVSEDRRKLAVTIVTAGQDLFVTLSACAHEMKGYADRVFLNACDLLVLIGPHLQAIDSLPLQDLAACAAEVASHLASQVPNIPEAAAEALFGLMQSNNPEVMTKVYRASSREIMSVCKVAVNMDSVANCLKCVACMATVAESDGQKTLFNDILPTVGRLCGRPGKMGEAAARTLLQILERFPALTSTTVLTSRNLVTLMNNIRNGDDAALPSVQILGNAIIQGGDSATVFVRAGLLEAVSECLGRTSPSTAGRADKDDREITVDTTSAPKLGLRLLIDENKVGAQVIAVNPGTLAANVGFRVGDRISTIDGQNLRGAVISEINSLLDRKMRMTIGVIRINDGSDTARHLLRKELCWTLANTLATNVSLIGTAIDDGIALQIIPIILSAQEHIKTQREALWVIINMVLSGTVHSIRVLGRLPSFISAFCQGLFIDSQELILATLTAIGNRLLDPALAEPIIEGQQSQQVLAAMQHLASSGRQVVQDAAITTLQHVSDAQAVTVDRLSGEFSGFDDAPAASARSDLSGFGFDTDLPAIWMTRPTQGGLGMVLNNAPDSLGGTFITNLKPGSVSALALATAGLSVIDNLRVVTINSLDMLGSSKTDCARAISQSREVIFVLRRDPAGMQALRAAFEGRGSPAVPASSSASTVVAAAPAPVVDDEAHRNRQAAKVIFPGTISVTIDKGTSSLGVILHVGEAGVFIGGMTPGSPADQHPDLLWGMQIRGINESSTEGLDKVSITSLLKKAFSCSTSVTLAVEGPRGAISLLVDSAPAEAAAQLEEMTDFLRARCIPFSTSMANIGNSNNGGLTRVNTALEALGVPSDAILPVMMYGELYCGDLQDFRGVKDSNPNDYFNWMRFADSEEQPLNMSSLEL